MHTHTHTHIHTHTYTHTHILTYIQTYIHTLHYITLHYITLHYITYIFYIYIYIAHPSQAERLQLGEEVGFRYVIDVIKTAVAQWNHAVETLKPQLENAETLLPLLEARFRADGRDDVPAQQKLEEIQQSLKTVLLRVVMKDSDNNLMKLGFIYICFWHISSCGNECTGSHSNLGFLIELWHCQLHPSNLRKTAQRICNKAGIFSRANTKPGKHLESDHPAVQKICSWVAYQTTKGDIHPRMVANYDQTWSVLYRPVRSCLQQKTKGDELSKHLSKRKIRHVLERCMGLDLTESLGPDENPVAKTPSVTGGKTATCPVESWRTPRTLCTLSWNDGTVGRGFITCREDSLTESQRQQANEAWGC